MWPNGNTRPVAAHGSEEAREGPDRWLQFIRRLRNRVFIEAKEPPRLLIPRDPISALAQELFRFRFSGGI